MFLIGHGHLCPISFLVKYIILHTKEISKVDLLLILLIAYVPV